MIDYLRALIRCYVKDDRAITAIEYGLLAALMGIVIVGITALFTDGFNNLFQAVGDQMQDGADAING